MRVIAGKFRGRRLVTPKEGVRPTSGRMREALFDILGPSIEGKRVLDLFAGSGAVGIEALSRGAESVTFVDTQVAAIQKNLRTVGAKATVLRLTVLEALHRLVKNGECFDIIFADPPYGREYGEELVRLIDSSDLLEERLFIEEKKIDELELETLRLEKTRKYGASLLFEFRVKPIS